MGILSTILGVWGFGLGTSIGVVIGYYMFIYFQPSDVKVSPSLSLVISCNLILISNFGFPLVIFGSVCLNCLLCIFPCLNYNECFADLVEKSLCSFGP